MNTLLSAEPVRRSKSGDYSNIMEIWFRTSAVSYSAFVGGHGKQHTQQAPSTSVLCMVPSIHPHDPRYCAGVILMKMRTNSVNGYIIDPPCLIFHSLDVQRHPKDARHSQESSVQANSRPHRGY